MNQLKCRMSRAQRRAVSLAGLVILMSVLGSCQKEQTVSIAVATFMHETCTFCPNPTTVADWEYYGPPTRDVLELGNSYIDGFQRMSEEFGGVNLVGLLSPRRSRGGSSGSWITHEAFDKYSYGIANDLKQAGPVDGVYLALHGAMAVTGIENPEAEIVRRVRKVAGSVPIVVTLDLHANEAKSLSDAADGVFIVKRYPHYDAALQGGRAARLMMKTIRGNYKPVMATRKPGVITPSVFQGTGVSPARDIMERARRWENQNADVYVSVAFGFAYADVPEVGAIVEVDAPGWGPADLSVLDYQNIPKDIYPFYSRK